MSSSIQSNKNKINICGTKPKTEPTPPRIPPAIKLVNHSAQPIASSPDVTPGIIHSPNNVSFIKPTVQFPIVPIDNV